MSHEIVRLLRAAGGADDAAREAGRAAIALVEKKRDAALAYRKPFEDQWDVDLAFLLGNTAVTLVDGRLIPGPATDDKLRVNIIRPRQRTLLSGLTARKPRFQAIVANADAGDAKIAAAQADEIVDGLTQTTGLARETVRAVLSGLITGRGFLAGGLDRTLGVDIVAQRCRSCGAHAPAAAVRAAGAALAGAPAAGDGGVAGGEDERGVGEPAAGAPRPSEVAVAAACPACGAGVAEVRLRAGEFFSRAYSSWDVAWDPVYARMSASPWVVLRNEMSVEEAEDRFGGTFRKESLKIGLSVISQGFQPPVREGVIVWEMLWRKTRAYPRGLRLLWHADRVLAWEEEISGDGEYPIGEISSDEALRGPYGLGILHDLRQPQIWTNKVLQYLMRAAELTADRAVVRGENTEIDADPHGEIASTEIVVPAGDIAPHYLPPPGALGDIVAVFNLLQGLADFATQQWDPARGQPGSSVRSGAHARILVEQTAIALSSISASTEEAVARVAKVHVMDAQRHMPEERLLAFAGDHGAPKVRRFRGADVKDVIDVRPVAGSASIRSKEAANDFYIDLLKSIGGPIDEAKRRIVEEMDAGVRLPTDPFQVVRDKSRAENDRILAGEMLAPTPDDFHEVEIGEHLFALSSDAVRQAPPEAVEVLRAHVAEHRRLRDQEAFMNQIRVQQIAAAGAPPEGAAAGAIAPEEGGIQ